MSNSIKSILKTGFVPFHVFMVKQLVILSFHAYLCCRYNDFQNFIIVQKSEVLIPGLNIYGEFKNEHCNLFDHVKFYPTYISVCTCALFRKIQYNFVYIFKEREILPKGVERGVEEPSLGLRLKVKSSFLKIKVEWLRLLQFLCFDESNKSSYYFGF